MKMLTEDEKKFIWNWRALPPNEQEGFKKILELFKLEKFKNKALNIVNCMNAGVLSREEGFKKIDRLWRRRDWRCY